MIPRKPRRSSILKPPKQVVRAPLQDLDSDDEGTLTQPTSRRVSFSRTSQIKEFDPSIGYITKWNQSYEESLGSIEGDENQPKSTNVFEGSYGVHDQEKFKRKRTSTLQLSLNSSNIGESNFNQPLHQIGGTTASKQPRKSLEYFQTEVVEEGDTALFFDELNLTEPVKCSYSNTIMSTNLSRTLEDTFNYSDTDLCQNKIDIVDERSTESDSKSSKNFNCNVGGIIADILPNKDSTFAGGRKENADIFVNKQGLNNTNLGSTKEVITSLNQSNEANNIEYKTSSNTSSTVMIGNDHDELTPLRSVPEKNSHLDDGKRQLGEYNCLETSIELTIPQIRYEEAMPERNYGEQDIQVNHCAQGSNLDQEDIEMTGTWGKILGKRNSILSSETKNVCANQGGERSSLTNVLVANEGSFKQKVADCTVGSDMELSMTYGGLVVEDNMVNMTLGPDEIHADMDGMELTVSLGKVKLSKAIDALENIDSFKLLETPDQLNNPDTMLNGKKVEEGLPKEMAENNSVEDVLNSTCYSEGLNETCPAVQGMEMTVSLGKIREKMAKSHDEDVKQTVEGIGDFAPWDQLKNELKPVQIVTENENHKERCIVDQTSDAELLICQKSQEMNEAQPEAEVMNKTSSLQQSYVDECKNSVDTKLCSQMGDTTNPALIGMDVTTPQESKEHVDTVDSSRKCSSKVDETNPDVMDMEFTIPLKKLKGEMDDFSRNAVAVSQIRDVTCAESMGLGKPLPIQDTRFAEYKDSVHKTVTESHVSDLANPDAVVMQKGEVSEGAINPNKDSQMMDNTIPGATGMELTVPLGRLKDHGGLVDNLLGESKIMDETIPDEMGMELTVPLGRLKREKCKDPVGSIIEQTQVVNDANPEEIGMKLPVPLSRLNEGKCKDPLGRMIEQTQVVNGTMPDEMGMELTVPLGRLKGEKGKDPIDSPLQQTQMVNDTNPEETGMELTVPLSTLTEDKCKDPVGSMIEQTQVVNCTMPDEMGMELTVPLGRLKREKCKDPVGSMIEQTQVVNDANPEEIGMELPVPLSRLTEGKCKDPVGSMIEQTQVVNGTMPDEMGMELTVPLGRLKGEKGEDPIDSPLQQTQMVNDTNPEETGMELTVPLSRLTEGKCKDPVSSMIEQTQVVNDANPEEIGMELPVPLSRLNEGKCKDPLGRMIEQTQVVNGTMPDEMGMELTVPLGRLKGEKGEDPIDSPLQQTQMVNDTNPEETGMELTIPLSRLTEGKCKDPVGSMIEQTQVVNCTMPDEMGMELTVPLGRLKREKCKDPVDSILQQPEMDDDDDLDEMGMELTVALGRLKGVKHIATGSQVVNPMDAKVECMKLATPSASVESQINQNSGNDPVKEGETNKDFFLGKSKCEDDILQTVNEGQALNIINTNSNDKLTITPAGEQVCGYIVNEKMSLPISKVFVHMEEEKLELSIPVCGQDEQGGSHISDVLSEIKSDTTFKDIQSESNTIIRRCTEKMIPEVEDKAVEDQRDKVTNPEQIYMEQSLSEAIDGNLQAVDIGCTKFPVINETTIRGDKMKEINVSTRRPVKRVRKSPVHNVVQLDAVNIKLTSSEINKSSDEYDLNSVLSQENCEQKIEENICEGKLMVSDDLVNNTARPPDERESLEETNVAFNKQVLANTNGTFAEMEVPLDKLKSSAKVGKMTVSLSSQLNTDVDINCGSSISNENTNQYQFSLDSHDCISNNGPGAVYSEVVPAMDLVLMPAFENEEQLHDNQVFAPVNRLATVSEEVAMDCAPFSEIDSKSDKNCMEPMDMSFRENLEPNGIESKTVHQSELDCSSMTECDESQLAKNLSNMEVEMREGTSSVAAATPDSSAVEMAINAPILQPLTSVEDWIKEESSKETCDWSVYKLLEHQYSFMVFHGTTVLIVNLKPLLEGQDPRDNRIVENVILKSCLEDDNEWCITVVLNVMLNKLTTELLSSKCSSTKELPSLFEFLIAEFYEMNLLLLQTYDLMRAGPVDYLSDGFTFRVPSMKRVLLFEVQINLLKWDRNGIKPEDAQVKNIIGNMRVTDIQSVVQSVKCDKCYFRNIYNEVLNFIDALEKVLE